MSAVYYYGQDGEKADAAIKKLFELDERELRWSNDFEASVFSVVGFVFKEDNILVIFPKHYHSAADLNTYNSTHVELSRDIELLYGVIRKYNEKAGVSARARAYIGAKHGYDSDYPFKPFYEIYGYFQRYGLYKQKEEKIVSGSSGKVSWKKTLAKAQKIISEGNLLFAPLYVKKKNYHAFFITECMAFIIDHTIENFHNFLSMKKTGYRRDKFDYLSNIDFVISQLNQYKNTVFKDMHKQLITSMIDFFEQYKSQTKSSGGKIHVRIRYFDMIWQDMIENYLNKHFVRMDSSGENVVFDSTQRKSPVSFAATAYSDIDNSSHRFSIVVDHIAYYNHQLYIFDSKYYFETNDLNYKQFSYNEILRYRYPGAVSIYSVLLLPGRNGSKTHFSLGANYVGSRIMGTKIIEQYLEPKIVMENYMEYI